MCGIVGIIQGYREQPADKRMVRSMAAALAHRGPDDEGFLFRGPVAMGIRRLSIIDVEGGHQPISNENGTVSVVFNGEIYNFAELREDLEARGHQFRTRSDTEVLVHLYEEAGDDLVDHLNGMFAFALWDDERQRLLLARDRMGEKPLYFSELQDKTFLFASELKALMLHPKLDRDINALALRKYLTYEFVPSPHSIIANVWKLPPAHRLAWERGKSWSMERYWSLSYSVPKLSQKPDELAEEIDYRLGESVRSRLVADVPLGILLSGGVDSSAIAALASNVAGSQVKTFSIGFDEPSFDESKYASEVARHLGTEHHEKKLTEKDLLDVLAVIPQLLDEPLGDGSLIPTFLLSKHAREFVKVALGGDGGDELFAGYPTYVAHQMAEYYRHAPAAIRERLIEPSVSRLPVSLNNLSFDFRAKRFVRGALLEPGMRHTLWMGSFDPEEQRRLLVPEILEMCPDEEVYSEVSNLTSNQASNGEHPIEGLMRLDATHYLSECVLVKVDRASMAASLEVRAPFLDHTFVEYVTRLPLELKLKGRTTKHILRQAMQHRLPRRIIARKKKGFGMPVGKWLRSELRDTVHDTLSPERLNRHGMFNSGYVQQLIGEHEKGFADNRKLLWTLLMFELWPGIN